VPLVIFPVITTVRVETGKEINPIIINHPGNAIFRSLEDAVRSRFTIIAISAKELITVEINNIFTPKISGLYAPITIMETESAQTNDTNVAFFSLARFVFARLGTMCKAEPIRNIPTAPKIVESFPARSKLSEVGFNPHADRL
jgi:hypothetical protein